MGRVQKRKRLKVVVLRYGMSRGEDESTQSKGGDLRPEDVQSGERKDHAESYAVFSEHKSRA